MRYHNISKCDLLNGAGIRVVLWLSHCEHKCFECQNPQTWSENSGLLFDKEVKDELFEAIKKPEIKGLTFSGGDPLSILNRESVLKLAKEIKCLFRDKDIWIYTGYSWSDIKDLKNIEYIDILVDGKFDYKLSKPSPKWRGSSNQRVIDVQESLKQNKVILSKYN